jgi:hypothetical protein
MSLPPRVPTPYHDANGVSKGWNEKEFNGVRFKGVTRTAPVLQEERHKINHEIGKERNSVLPSTLYPANVLTVEHLETGITLTFSCMDALRQQDNRSGYMGTIGTNKDTFRKILSRKRLIESPNFGKPIMQPTPKIPIELLRQHGDMHFYDSIVLFKHEVKNTVKHQMEVKIRTMDSFYLILLREHIHIIGKSVTLRDVRYFYAFDQSSIIIRDLEERHSTIEELRNISMQQRPRSASLNERVKQDETFFTQPEQVYEYLKPRKSLNQIIPTVIE